MGGGAWPFLVGGAICLVNSDNERDSSLLNRWLVFIIERFLGFSAVGSLGRLFGASSFGAGLGAVGARGNSRFYPSWVCVGRRRFRAVGSPGCSGFSRQSHIFLEGQAASSRVTVSNNRSVMPLDVLGRTRATLKESACLLPPVRKDRVTAEPPSWLGLGTAMIPMNQESLVGASH